MDFFNFPEVSPSPQSLPVPDFISYEVDLAKIRTVADKYKDYKKLIIVAHGGSVSTFYGIYHALRTSGSTKQVYFVSTPDPEYISEIKSKCSQDDTLVLAISKSGQDMTMLESLSAFFDYKGIVISEEGTALTQVGEQLGWERVHHPRLGGRFTGLTEVALLPAALCGFDIEGLIKGSEVTYQTWESGGEAWNLADAIYGLEQLGLSEVFVLIYSRMLFSFNWLISQLCHETFGKDGQGLTYIIAEGPEWQHHTMQRFLDGPKNAAGVFIGIDEMRTEILSRFDPVNDVHIKNATLNDVNGIAGSKILNIELDASLLAASKAGIPVAKWILLSLRPETVGEFIAFWQMFAVYSAHLRGVNPFDQPAVEESKENSFQHRLEAARK